MTRAPEYESAPQSAEDVLPDAERWRPERDLLAEKILLAWHTVEWYIGDATQEEWEMAYAAADAALNDGTVRDG